VAGKSVDASRVVFSHLKTEGKSIVIFARRSKFNNRSCRCGQGHIHHSRFEAGYCDQLELLRRAGEIKSYRTQVRYDLTVFGKRITTHVVDFEVIGNDDRLEVHEAKGMETDIWRIKKKLFEAIFPNVPYVVVR